MSWEILDTDADRLLPVLEEPDASLDEGPVWRYSRWPKRVMIFDSDRISGVPVASLLDIHCREEARGRLAPCSTGDRDPEGGLEQPRSVSSGTRIQLLNKVEEDQSLCKTDLRFQ